MTLRLTLHTLTNIEVIRRFWNLGTELKQVSSEVSRVRVGYAYWPFTRLSSF